MTRSDWYGEGNNGHVAAGATRVPKEEEEEGTVWERSDNSICWRRKGKSPVEGRQPETLRLLKMMNIACLSLIAIASFILSSIAFLVILRDPPETHRYYSIHRGIVGYVLINNPFYQDLISSDSIWCEFLIFCFIVLFLLCDWLWLLLFLFLFLLFFFFSLCQDSKLDCVDILWLSLD